MSHRNGILGGKTADDETYHNKLRQIVSDNLSLGTSDPTPVLPHIVLGSQQHAESLKLLRHLGITHVLNCAGLEGPRSDGLKTPYDGLDIDCYQFCAHDNDTYDITKHFKAAFAYLDNVKRVGGRALVHCALGINRSAAVTVGYLMVFAPMPLLEAVHFVSSKRKCILSNQGFRLKLVQFARREGLLDALEEERQPEQPVLVAAPLKHHYQDALLADKSYRMDAERGNRISNMLTSLYQDPFQDKPPSGRQDFRRADFRTSRRPLSEYDLDPPPITEIVIVDVSPGPRRRGLPNTGYTPGSYLRNRSQSRDRSVERENVFRPYTAPASTFIKSHPSPAPQPYRTPVSSTYSALPPKPYVCGISTSLPPRRKSYQEPASSPFQSVQNRYSSYGSPGPRTSTSNGYTPPYRPRTGSIDLGSTNYRSSLGQRSASLDRSTFPSSRSGSMDRSSRGKSVSFEKSGRVPTRGISPSIEGLGVYKPGSYSTGTVLQSTKGYGVERKHINT